jgi:hypothetical protein
VRLSGSSAPKIRIDGAFERRHTVMRFDHREVHVALPTADPNLAKEHATDDHVGVPVNLDGIGTAGRVGGKHASPFASAVGLSDLEALPSWAGQFDFDRFPRVCCAPKVDFRISLKDAVVGNEGRNGNWGLAQGKGEQRGEHDFNATWF